MSKTKQMLTLVIAFFFTLVLCLWVLVAALLTTVYTPGFISRHIDDAYCTAAYSGLLERWSSYGEPALIPPSVFEEALSEEQFSVELIAYTQSVWDGDATARPDTDAVGEQLMSAFLAYAKAQDVPITDELSDALGTLRDACVTAYRNYTEIPLLSNISSLVQRLYKPVLVVFFGISLLLVMLVFLTVRIHRYWFHGTRDMVYTLFAGFLVLAPPAILVLTKNPFVLINLEPEYFRLLLVGLTNRYMLQLLIAAAAMLLVGIVLLIVSEQKHREKFHPKERIPGHLVMNGAETDTPANEPTDGTPRHAKKNF